MMGWIASVPRGRSLFLILTDTTSNARTNTGGKYKEKYKDSWLGVAMAMMGWIASVPRWTRACCNSVHHLAVSIVAASPNARVPWRRWRWRWRRLGWCSAARVHPVADETRPADASNCSSAVSTVGVVVTRAWVAPMVCVTHCVVMVAAIVSKGKEESQGGERQDVAGGKRWREARGGERQEVSRGAD